MCHHSQAQCIGFIIWPTSRFAIQGFTRAVRANRKLSTLACTRKRSIIRERYLCASSLIRAAKSHELAGNDKDDCRAFHVKLDNVTR